LDSGDTVTLSANDLPTGASFDAATGVFDWTPTNDQSGSYNVIFIASDGILEDSEVVTISVIKTNSLTLEVSPQNSGVVFGGGEYIKGTIINIEADANEDYTFINWTINGNDLSTLDDFEYTMPEHDVILTANFLIDITGSGTKENPFLINTFNGLEKVGDKQKGYALNAYYRLNANIDASRTKDINYNDEKGWRPISYYDNSINFSGVFDGQNYEISNLYIKNPDCPNGLFSKTTGEAIIKNVKLIDYEIYDYYTGGGGLVGINYGTISDCHLTGYIYSYSGGGLVGRNFGTIESCSASGSVNGGGYEIGGLVGLNRGLISNCHARSTIKSEGSYSGNYSVGGLIGSNAGTITNCSANGDVYGDSMIGGLIGLNSGDIKLSRAYCNVNGKERTGGLVGYNSTAVIEDSFANGSVYGKIDTGGLVGSSYASTINSEYFFARIEKCYATVNVSGENNTGGLVGRNSYGAIRNSYSTGNVDGTEKVGGLVGNSSNSTLTENSYSVGEVQGINLSGGLIGLNGGTIINSYWNTETSGLDWSDGGEGKTTEQMMQQPTFVDWDFITVWDIDKGYTYPYLR